MRRIDLDHVSTTAMAEEVRDAMLPYLGKGYGNPSSPNRRGRAARAAVETAREQVAAMLGARPGEIIFTGSATEASNLAIRGIATAAGQRRRHLAAAATEHISILHPLRTVAKSGIRITTVRVDGSGLLNLDHLEKTLSDPVALLCVAHGSAEIGTLQPLETICRLAHARGTAVHVDATATAGLVPLPGGETSPDLITLTPHLFYGPQGVGALRAREAIRLAPLIEGGGQERGLRAGTEPVAAIVGFGAAAALALRDRERRATRARRLAERARRLLIDRIEGIVMTGHPERRIPGLVTLCIRGVEAEALLQAMEDSGIDAASGSACTTEAGKTSHVLEAIAVDAQLARGALTLSFGEQNNETDPEKVAEILPDLVARLRTLSPLEPT